MTVAQLRAVLARLPADAQQFAVVCWGHTSYKPVTAVLVCPPNANPGSPQGVAILDYQGTLVLSDQGIRLYVPPDDTR